MSARFRQSLLAPLLASYRRERASAVPPRSGRSVAIHAAAGWWNGEFVDAAPDARLADRVREFHAAVVPVPWHPDAAARKPALLRFALNHLRDGHDSLGTKLQRCCDPAGPYYRPGLGRLFWAALAQATDPAAAPDWTPGVVRGAAGVGLLTSAQLRDPAAAFDGLHRLYRGLLAEFPDLTAPALDDFFRRVATQRGRDLGPAEEPAVATKPRLERLLRRLRTATPLRRATAAHAERLAALRSLPDDAARLAALLGGWSADDDALLPRWQAVADACRAPADLLQWPLDGEAVGRVRGVEAVAALLHLRKPKAFTLWNDAARRGVAALSDGVPAGGPAWEQYRTAGEVAAWLRDELRLHSAELPAFLAACEAEFAAPEDAFARPRTPPGEFGGFSADTFRFLAELPDNNAPAWMAAHRERYAYAVREPMVELCDALAAQYVEPVVNAGHGWDLETAARPGKALTSICKNDFGRGEPYLPEMWVAFYRRAAGQKRHDAQLFAKLDAGGLLFGFRLGPGARQAGKRFRKAVQEHGEKLFACLPRGPAADGIDFGPPGAGVPRSAADLRQWAAGKDLTAARRLPADAPQLRSGELVGEVLLTFDRLLPLLAAATDDDPRPALERRAGGADARPAFDAAAFARGTHLSETWLTRALDLLQLKKQLILQGVPGTGKTHVAQQLARHLTGDAPGRVRLVQFHPGYAYEEFVEGIRPRPASDGTQSFAVEPGLLVSFAELAVKQPSLPHVLIVDEVNRGNLPRVFGELLFLLEYRDREVTLPYSQRRFSLPANLYLLGTMNPADQSVGALDQALRRRFSFVEMPPDAAVLARWLDAHPPADADESFGPRLVAWFEELNRKLGRDAGPDRLVGHSFFMVEGLTRDTLRTIWAHQVRPILEPALPGRADRLDALAPTRLTGSPRGPAPTLPTEP